MEAHEIISGCGLISRDLIFTEGQSAKISDPAHNMEDNDIHVVGK